MARKNSPVPTCSSPAGWEHGSCAPRLPGWPRWRHCRPWRGTSRPDMQVRIANPADAPLFDHVAEGVFDNAVEAALLREFLGDPRHHLAIALEGGSVLGMASAVHYVHPDKPAELWINEVGVGDSHRGRGIGRQLLETLKAHGRALGCREAWVLTEADNAAARGLYRAVGGAEAGVVYVTIPLT